MLNELRRYNNVGDVNGINYFMELILRDEKIQKVSVQKLCALRNNIRLNFGAVVTLFKYLGIIEEKGGCLLLTEFGKNQLDLENIEFTLCRTCYKKIITDGILDISAIHYSLSNNEYTIERYGFAVSAALFRNMLLQYKALIEKSGELVIPFEYEALFVQFQKINRVGKSLESLKKQLEQQAIQGAKAEEYVMNYELNRLKNHPSVNAIKQISIIDVSAGYDIISFENEVSSQVDLFIEVKSYIGNPHFYWSDNEIKTARLYEDKYCIYLIDITRVDDESYRPRIIRNPAKNIIDSDLWILNPTSYRVIPTD